MKGCPSARFSLRCFRSRFTVDESILLAKGRAKMNVLRVELFVLSHRKKNGITRQPFPLTIPTPPSDAQTTGAWFQTIVRWNSSKAARSLRRLIPGGEVFRGKRCFFVAGLAREHGNIHEDGGIRLEAITLRLETIASSKKSRPSFPY